MKKMITCAVLGVSVVALTSWAQPGPREGRGVPPEGRGPNQEMLARHLEKMNLDEATREQLRTLHEAHITLIRERMEAQRAAGEKVRELFESGASESELMAAVDAQVAAFDTLQRARVQHQLKVRELIGPENADKLRAQLREQLGQRERPERPTRTDRPERPDRPEKPLRDKGRPATE